MASSPNLATVSDVGGHTFDYVIIGGGTAGCVLASRLSEDPKVSVAVLEAGKSSLDDPLVAAPMGYLREIRNPEYDWMFAITPQQNAPVVHLHPWARGKMLGGSSAINIMAYTKPVREELDALETLGNPGWNWGTYQKYAKRLERFCTPLPPIMDEEFRNLYNPDSVGHDGKLTVTFIPTGSGADAAFQQSVANNGVDIVRDALDGEVIGIWKGLSTVDPQTGHRVDAAKAYLLPALGRPNLTVLTEAYVCRILTRTEDGSVIASGVEFEHGGTRYTVSAGREVILSAGALKTPQILELSGIGDPRILEPHGIKTVVNLPAVGTNAQEHITSPTLLYRMREDKGVVTTHVLVQEERMKEVYARLNLKGDFNLLINNFAFVPLHVASDQAEALIARKKAALAHADLPPGLRKQYEVQLQLLESGRGADVELMSTAVIPWPIADPTKPHMGFAPALTRPWSRGTVHIASADPKAAPQIDPHYLEDEFDLEVLAEGWKFARKVGQTKPWTDVSEAQVNPPPEMDLSTDEQVRELVKKNIVTTWHTCGTASMLPRELDGVVDPTLKVYGTKNLRVVDLSILPLQISVHPQAFVYALAEQASDIIKGAAATAA